MEWTEWNEQNEMDEDGHSPMANFNEFSTGNKLETFNWTGLSYSTWTALMSIRQAQSG